MIAEAVVLLSVSTAAAAELGTELHCPASGSIRAAQSAPTAATSDSVTVTVFSNVSGAAPDDWIGTGIVETLAAYFEGADGVSVIGRQAVSGASARVIAEGSAAEATGTAVAAGRLLGARWVITGGYQRLGDRLRVTARVVEVATATVVHTAEVDGPMTNLFALQDRLAAELKQGLTVARAVVAPGPAATEPGDGRRVSVDVEPPAPAPQVSGAPERVAAAPGPSAAVRGTIYDVTGAALVGASVVLVDGRGGVWETQTDGEGGYRFDPVAPGDYSLTANAEGFAAVTQAVDLSEPATSTLDVTLAVLISVEVDVTDDLLGISAEPGRNLSSFILTGRDIEALPNNPRLFRQRLAEMAGHVGPGGVTFYIDGFTESFRFPPKGTIQMIRISANSFDAEFQEPGQQRIEIITKPGSGQFFGEVDTGFTDEAINARNPLTFTKPSQQNRTVSSYLGGPLIPNHWGFLVYGGRWEQDENASVYAIGLDPATLEPQRVATTVPTPSRVTNFTEPYRVCRRAFSLRGWSHVTTESVFPRSTRASGAAGPRARG